MGQQDGECRRHGHTAQSANDSQHALWAKQLGAVPLRGIFEFRFLDFECQMDWGAGEPDWGRAWLRVVGSETAPFVTSRNQNLEAAPFQQDAAEQASPVRAA